MKIIEKNDWRVYYHPIFAEQWQELLTKAKSLKAKLTKEKWETHPDVKLFRGVDIGIREKITNDPLAFYFALQIKNK